MKEINILYGMDEGKKDYSRYLGVSIMSLLEHNKDENIHIYILSENIEESNKNEIIRIVKDYGKKVSFSEGNIVPDKFKELMKLKGNWHYATYYRFFFNYKFDIKDRLLYLDCDTIINRNLSEFYNMNFDGNAIIGKLDNPLTRLYPQKKYLLNKYINAGVLLINLELFLKVDLFNEVKKINKKYGIPEFNDQDYINIIFNDKIKIFEYSQALVHFYNYLCSDYSKYFIIHTFSKPNSGGCSFCPKNIEELFNKYLSKTKWKNWIGYKRDVKFNEYLTYIYSSLSLYLTYISLKLFGLKFALSINSFFSKLGVLGGKIFRKFGLIK